MNWGLDASFEAATCRSYDLTPHPPPLASRNWRPAPSQVPAERFRPKRAFI